jgi:thiol-disulfide isomerase/thioredoxin
MKSIKLSTFQLSIMLVLSLYIIGCAPAPEESSGLQLQINNVGPSEQTEEQPQQELQKQEPAWKTIPLTDVLSGNSFTIADFLGKPVLLESFAVWCPTCTKQQREIQKLHEELGDSVVSIALDTDPNEDADAVGNHATSNGFDWSYVVAPREVTQSLVDEFGNSVVNAPAAPVILVCQDGSSELLSKGVKRAGELKAAIEACA